LGPFKQKHKKKKKKKKKTPIRYIVFFNDFRGLGFAISSWSIRWKTRKTFLCVLQGVEDQRVGMVKATAAMLALQVATLVAVYSLMLVQAISSSEIEWLERSNQKKKKKGPRVLSLPLFFIIINFLIIIITEIESGADSGGTWKAVRRRVCAALRAAVFA
jgi:hypothetical protein